MELLQYDSWFEPVSFSFVLPSSASSWDRGECELQITIDNMYTEKQSLQIVFRKLSSHFLLEKIIQTALNEKTSSKKPWNLTFFCCFPFLLFTEIPRRCWVTLFFRYNSGRWWRHVDEMCCVSEVVELACSEDRLGRSWIRAYLAGPLCLLT